MHYTLLRRHCSKYSALPNAGNTTVILQFLLSFLPSYFEVHFFFLQPPYCCRVCRIELFTYYFHSSHMIPRLNTDSEHKRFLKTRTMDGQAGHRAIKRHYMVVAPKLEVTAFRVGIVCRRVNPVLNNTAPTRATSKQTHNTQEVTYCCSLYSQRMRTCTIHV